MARTIYSNNSVEITVEIVDSHEAKVNVNGENLIWISRDQLEDFEHALTNLLDNYRI